MKRIGFLALAILAGCANAAVMDAPATSWGKAHVPMTSFLADAAYCASLSANVRAEPEVLVQSRIGGIPSTAMSDDVDTATHSIEALTSAANERRNVQIRADTRARQAAHDACLRERGYTQFRLNSSQRHQAASMPEASEARRSYLHRLGADPIVLAAQHM